MKIIDNKSPDYHKYVMVEDDKHYEITPKEGCEILCPYDPKMSVKI